MVHYNMVQTSIDALKLIKLTVDKVMRHYGLSKLIISDCGSQFTTKFWLLLCYFLGIKFRLSTAFYLQINSQTIRKNSIMEAHL